MDSQERISRKPTLDDVASLAGVSRMAASVVLNGARSGTRVSQAKRQQILDVAKELEYRPNLVARSLARSATHVFGFYSGFDYLDVRNPFIAEITAGLLEECSQCSRDLLLHTLFRGQDIKNLSDELLSGKIDGLVVWAPDDDPLISLLRESHLPVVSIVETIPPFPSVGVDDYTGAFEIGRHLAECGHRSVLYITQRRPSRSRRLRQAGIEEAAKQMGLQLGILLDPTYDDLVESLTSGSLPGLKPTAIACWNDMVAHQVLFHCQRAGISVPHDLAITGFDGIESPFQASPILTTIHAPWSRVASTAVNHLIDLIQGKDVPQETVLPVELIRGNTA